MPPVLSPVTPALRTCLNVVGAMKVVNTFVFVIYCCLALYLEENSRLYFPGLEPDPFVASTGHRE